MFKKALVKCSGEEYPSSSAMAAMPFLLSCICGESDKFTDAQEAILEVFPLDQYVEKLVYLMKRVHGDNADVLSGKSMRECSYKQKKGEI